MRDAVLVSVAPLSELAVALADTVGVFLAGAAATFAGSAGAATCSVGVGRRSIWVGADGLESMATVAGLGAGPSPAL